MGKVEHVVEAVVVGVLAVVVEDVTDRLVAADHPDLVQDDTVIVGVLELHECDRQRRGQLLVGGCPSRAGACSVTVAVSHGAGPAAAGGGSVPSPRSCRNGHFVSGG